MKFILGLVSLAFLASSCSNELVVADQWKDIPIVWGLLSKSDTAHYIRVEKAFLDPNTSAYTIAKIPDSLYYENAVVTLRRVASGQVYTLTKVDGNTEGFPRDTGIFADTPNYLYKIKANQINLVIGDKYEFGLQRDDHSALVTSLPTIILPKPVLRNPSKGSLLSYKTGSSFNHMWNEIPDAGIFDLKQRFHYREKSPQTGNVYIPLVVEWTIAQGLTEREYKIDGAEFYNAVKANIEEDFEATRLFDSTDIVIWCGGKELETFITIAQANQGITATQDIPEYSNLSEGKGVITSRNVSFNTGFQLTNQSLDSLKNGSITRHLNFK